MSTLYRGYEITQEPSGMFVWTDERGIVHNGKVDMRGGFMTEEQAAHDIDKHKKALRT